MCMEKVIFLPDPSVVIFRLMNDALVTFLFFLPWLDSAVLADAAQLMVSSVQLCWRILLAGRELCVQISAI